MCDFTCEKRVKMQTKHGFDYEKHALKYINFIIIYYTKFNVFIESK